MICEEENSLTRDNTVSQLMSFPSHSEKAEAIRLHYDQNAHRVHNNISLTSYGSFMSHKTYTIVFFAHI